MRHKPESDEQQPSICRGNVQTILNGIGNDRKQLRHILIVSLLRNAGVARLTADMFEMTWDEAADIGAELDQNMSNTFEEDDLQYWLLLAGYWFPMIDYLED